MSATATLSIGRVYGVMVGDDSDERMCEAIPESACHHQPVNFVLNVANGSATKLAEQLASPGLVLPWLLASIGAPAAFAGWLVPLKQAGSLIPQMAAAAAIRDLARRKWAWVGAGLFQAAALALMIPAVLTLPPIGAGIAILVLLTLFSMASGVGSVAFQDVMPKTIAKGLRGRLLSMRAAIGGALTLVAAGLMTFSLGDEAALAAYLWLVAIAAVLWIAGAVFFTAIREQPGATEGGRNPISEFRTGLHFAREQSGFRGYLHARAALAIIEISVPFYALYAHRLFEGTLQSLGIFVFAVGLANVLSSPFWGRFADASSRQVMMISAGFSAAAAVLALIFGLLPLGTVGPWLYMLVFLVIGIAEAGVRLGRKTYIADGAPANERPIYVAFSNLLAGVVMLAGGAVGLIGQLFGLPVLLLVIVALSLLAVIVCKRLPEASDMVR